MKHKKFTLIFFVMSVILIFSLSTAHATWYYSYNITKIGYEDGEALVSAQNDAGTSIVQRNLDSVNKNQLLAVALSAQGFGAKVHLEVVSNRIVSITIVQ